MSYAQFQKEAGNYKRWREANNLPSVSMEEEDNYVRDKWLEDKRYRELVLFILENWSSGNCESFCKPVYEHLLKNKEVRFFKMLCKGIIKHRLDKLWGSCYSLVQVDENCTLGQILAVDISGYNQFSIKETVHRSVAWRREYTMSAIKYFIKGLKELKEDKELKKQEILLENVSNLYQPESKPSSDKRKIDEALFWNLIDEARSKSSHKLEFLDEIKTLLENFHPKEIRRFDKFLFTKAYELNTYEHWALAYIALNGCGDDYFDYFKFWAVSKGKENYENIKNIEINKLKDIFDETPLLELFSYIASEVYEDKTSEIFKPMRVKYKKLKGKMWNEDDLPNLYPEIWKIFN